jgi:hypothetical protein
MSAASARAEERALLGSGAFADQLAMAERTRLDVDALDVLIHVVRAVQVAATDAALDRAAALLGVLLSLLPVHHPLVLAARAGLEVGDGRRHHRAAVAEASRAISAAVPKGWAHRWMPFGELQRRRTEPGTPPTHRQGVA